MLGRLVRCTNNMDAASETRVVDFATGWPSTTLLPTAAISQAAQAALADVCVAHQGLGYGPDEGHEPLREAIADWNTSFYQPSHVVTKDDVAITGGASQNLGCVLQVFTDPAYTRNIWIVAPSYMLVFRIFEDSGFAGKMRAVPEGDQGVDIEFLRRELEKSETKATAEGNLQPVSGPVSCGSECFIVADLSACFRRNSNPRVHGQRSTVMSSTVCLPLRIRHHAQCL